MLRLLGNRAHLLLAIRLRAKGRFRAAVPARDSWWAIHQPARASYGSGAGPSLARGGKNVRGGESAFRRHREGHAFEQSRGRHDTVLDGQGDAAERHPQTGCKPRRAIPQFRGRNVFRRFGCASRRLAEKTTTNHPSWADAVERPCERAPATREFRARAKTSGRK